MIGFPFDDEKVEAFKRVGNDPDDENDFRYGDDDRLVAFGDRLTDVVDWIEVTHQHIAEQDQEAKVGNLERKRNPNDEAAEWSLRRASQILT